MPLKHSPNYVVTVKFGKEDFSARELGDAIFPYDSNVLVVKTKFKGVLLLYTNLSFPELLRVLAVFPPAYVERIVKVDFCCPVDEARECVTEQLTQKRIQYGTVRFGRIGSLGRELAREIENLLIRYRNCGNSNVLHVEPINDHVCFGVMVRDADKFYLIRKKRIGML
ncbi:MAG: hypothetical protein J7L12_04300, partial [Desulfurococcales archaeon]|nr:hypothetical protein [Desulfurococcales archaeon]